MTVQLALGLTLLLGLPLMLLAIGVLVHAYVIARPPAGATPDALVEAMVAESMEQLIAEVRGVLRGPAGAFLGAESAPAAQATLVSSGAVAPPSVAQPAALAPSGANLASAVAQLVGEGLSDRTIARRLSVGIEEVRVARAPRGGSR